MIRTTLGCTLAACFWLVTAAATPTFAGVPSPDLLRSGTTAPNFTFSDIQTSVATPFAGFARGRPLVLVFLQTACRSCQREMATLKHLHRDLGGFEVLGIFLDMKPKNFKNYIDENQLPFTFAWDSDYSIAEAYGVAFTPASYLLDTERRIVKVYRGFHPGMDRALKEDLTQVMRGN